MIIAVYIRNFCSCEKKAWKKFSLVRDSSPWPLRYQCSALPTYQANWEQVVECAFATAKVCIWLRWDDHPSFDSSLRSSLILTARRWRSKHWKKKTKNIFKHLYFLFYSFAYFFIALPQGSVCRSYFSTGLIVLIQVYNWEIRHHSLVCCCGLADILYILLNDGTFSGAI